MVATDVIVLVAAVVACLAALVAGAAAVVLVGQVRRLERAIEAVRAEAVPLVHEARQAVDHAAAGMARVEAVLEDTESVTATVDSASRLAQRVFANPVVKVLAWRAGAAGGLRRLGQPATPARTATAAGNGCRAASTGTDVARTDDGSAGRSGSGRSGGRESRGAVAARGAKGRSRR